MTAEKRTSPTILSTSTAKNKKTTNSNPLSAEEIRTMNAYWHACNYLCAGMLYLRENPLLKEPLKPEHIKQRLFGHWGSDPGQTFTWVHLNRLIKKYDLDMIYISGPGHGAPATLSNAYLPGIPHCRRRVQCSSVSHNVLF